MSHQVLLDALPCAAAVLDQRQHLVAANQAWLELMGEATRPDDEAAARLLDLAQREALGGGLEKSAPIVHAHRGRWLQSRVTRLVALGEGALVTHEDVSTVRTSQQQLREVLEATTAHVGRELLRAMARQMALLHGARYGVVAVLKRTAIGRVRTLAVWADGGWLDNFEYLLAGTPSEQLYTRSLCLHPRQVSELFPTDVWLAQHRIQAHLGVPLLTADGVPLGHLAALSTAPFERPIDTQLIRVLATRAGTEVSRMRAERSAHDSDVRLQVAVEATTDGSFEFDLITGEVRGNARLNQMLGYPSNALRHIRDWEAITHPDDLPRVREALVLHLKGHNPGYRAELRVKAADGTWRWLLDRGRVVERTPQGRALRMAGLHSDISERKRLELQVQVSERMASVGSLAASLAHEVNTPLAYLTAALDSLTHAAPGDAAAALQMAREGAERIRDVVRDVKAFSHIDPDARRCAIELHEPLTRALRLARREVNKRGRLLEEVGALPSVDGNATQLAHVFLNLLMNAAQAAPEGDGTAHQVHVVARTGVDGWAEVEVHDTGRGIPADVAPHVFEQFFTTRPAGEGSGLGLAICQSTVNAHGGTLSFSSQPGHTRFLVRLPPTSSMVVLPMAAQVRPVPQAVSPTAAATRRQVLVVDDHPAMGTSLKLMLNDEHDVDTVTNATAALELLGRRQYDVILCDLMMPDISGIDLYRLVQRDQPRVAERFVFMTGGAATASAVTFLEQTRCRVLEKPFRPEALRAVLYETDPAAPGPAQSGQTVTGR